MNDGLSLNFRLRIRYPFLWCAAIVMLVCGLAYLYSRAGADLRQTITYGSSLLGATIAIISLIYTADTLNRSNREKSRAAAARFIERWNDPRYFDLKQKWRSLTEEIEPLTPEQRFHCLDKDISKRTTAVEVFNFLEELSVAINIGSVDEDVVKRFFHTILLRYFTDYRYWIEQHRTSRRAPRFCVELEEVARKWNRSRLEGPTTPG